MMMKTTTKEKTKMTMNQQSHEDEEDVFQVSAEKERYDKLNDKEIEIEALSELNISEERLKDELDNPLIKSKDTLDAITSIEEFVNNFEHFMHGREKERTTKEEKYVQVGKALGGEQFIRRVSGMMRAFANKSMLVSKKTEEDFIKQFEDVFYTTTDMMVNVNSAIDVDSARAIMEKVKHTMWNIGDILTGTKGNMPKLFDTMDKAYNESNDKINGDI